MPCVLNKLCWATKLAPFANHYEIMIAH